MLRITLTAATLLMLAPAAFAEVYRFVDKDGNVQYTDKPALLPAERLAVQSRSTDAAAVAARAEAERARTTAADAARQQTTAQQGEQRSAAQIAATARAEQCARARERLDNYTMSRRLYEMLPDGERRYLSEDEADQARANAEKAVAESCSN